MAKAKKGVIDPETKIKIKTEVSREEIIAIAVSREEERLTDLMNEKRTAVKAMEKDRNDAEKRIDEIIADLIQKAVGKYVSDANKALAACGLSEVVSVSSDGVDWKESKIRYCVVNGERGYNRDGNKRTVQINAEMKKLRKKVDGLNEEISAIVEEGVAAQQQLAKLPTLERQARAKLAEGILSQTAEGQALLDSIQSVKSLPYVSQ